MPAYVETWASASHYKEYIQQKKQAQEEWKKRLKLEDKLESKGCSRKYPRGGPHFFSDPSTPRTHMESESPRPPGHVSALINLPHYGSNTPWPPGQVTSPQCLWPPQDNFWNSPKRKANAATDKAQKRCGLAHKMPQKNKGKATTAAEVNCPEKRQVTNAWNKLGLMWQW